MVLAVEASVSLQEKRNQTPRAFAALPEAKSLLKNTTVHNLHFSLGSAHFASLRFDLRKNVQSFSDFSKYNMFSCRKAQARRNEHNANLNHDRGKV